MKSSALITGASAGIGAAFARRLASDGFDLTLVARRAARLEQLAAELRDRHATAASVVTADLAQADHVRRVAETIERSPNLELLINNAGFGSQDTFAESDLNRQLEMVAVHVTATMSLCRAALPGMIARRNGTIINVSSIAGFLPVVGKATYNATKSFLTMFSQVLQEELRGYGVRVQALCPGFTWTEFHDTPEYGDFDRSTVPRWMWMSAERVVEISLAASRKNRVVVIPGFKNRIIVAASRYKWAATLLRFLRLFLMKRWRR